MVGALLVSALWIDIKTDFMSTVRYENGMEDLVFVALSNNQ
jgi:hypoxanthine-guanine phosphoribosyltransferase